MRTPKRRATNPPELQEASRQMSTVTTLNKALANREKPKVDEDQTELFCKMLAKQIKEYPQFERE